MRFPERSPLKAELRDFPAKSLIGVNGSSETLTYGHAVTVKWDVDDIDPVRVLFISRHYHSLRWLLSPLLGVSTLGDVIVGVMGIAVPFVAGIFLVLLADGIKAGARAASRPLIALIQRRKERIVEERRLLEKLLPPGMSVDDYLKTRKHRK